MPNENLRCGSRMRGGCRERGARVRWRRASALQVGIHGA